MPKKSTFPPAMQAVLKAGGPSQLARALGGGVTAGAVQQWMLRGSIPTGHILGVSAITGVPVRAFLEYEAQRIAQTNKVGSEPVNREGNGAESESAGGD